MSNMTDDIGYQITDQDVAAVIHWLEINDPENANEKSPGKCQLVPGTWCANWARVVFIFFYKHAKNNRKKTA